MSVKCEKSFTLTIKEGIQLISYWTLNETVGNRLDSVDSNHLAPIGLQTFATGIIGNGLRINNTGFDGVLKVGSTSFIPTNKGITICGWYKPLSLPPFSVQQPFNIDCYNNLNVNTQSFSVTKRSSGKLQFSTTDTGVPIGTLAPIAGNWYFFAAWMSTDLILHLQINDGTVEDGTTPVFASGFVKTDIYIVNAADMVVDESLIYNGVLTAADRTYLYNSGVGRTYPDVPYA